MFNTASHSSSAGQLIMSSRPAFGRTPALLLAVLLGSVVLPGMASAQGRAVIERNLPPPVTGQGGIIIDPGQLAGPADTTPFGVDVAGVRLIGPAESPSSRPSAGVSIGDVGDMPHDRLQAVLVPFMGRPLSPKLIADMQAAIARAYREVGHPFVSVTAPPQEITRGILQLRVAEFRYGHVGAKGVAPAEGEALRARVRAQTGARITAPLLEEDLDWLNRYPYRSVEGVFAPGDAFGTSALTLEVTPQKPWQVFAGWSNTGTNQTGFDRYFAGFGAALPVLGDSFFSYQATGSWNFWSDPGSLGTGPDAPRYFSQAARVVLSPMPRQSLEIAPNFVATRQDSAERLFAFTNTTFELPVTYRTALSNFFPGQYLGDLILGAVGRQISRTSYFERTDIGGSEAGVFELIIGWAGRHTDAYGTSTLETRLVVNPGGVLGGNTAQTWAAYSAGRVDDVTYAYGTLEAGRVVRLPMGLAYVGQFNGLWAGQPLPDTEQLAIGGMHATRGYVLDDASVDTGLVWRNELRLPAFALLAAVGMLQGVSDEVSPYVFFDLGYGFNYGYEGPLGMVAGYNTHMAGIGGGIDYRLASNLQASFVAGYALSDAGVTDAGDWTLQGRLFLSY